MNESDQIEALVVDNNPVLLKAISAIVEQEGCRVSAAEDGLQALETMRSIVPDIVFTDLVMPLVDGAQLCKIIRKSEELKHVYIVVVSAIPYEETKKIMAEIDCDLCIVKGSLQEMRDHIRQALTLRSEEADRAGRILGSPDKLEKEVGEQSGIAAEILTEKRHREEIVAYLSEGVIELNEQGKIVEVNRSVQNILDMPEEQMIGLTIDRIGWAEYTSAVEAWVRKELIGRGLGSLDIADNEPVFRNDKILTMTLLAVEGTSYFGICIIRDITRQYKAEQFKRNLDRAVRLVRKMEAMSGMAGGVAHDFNNLLTVILGNIDMISFSLKDNNLEKTEELLEQARRSTRATIDLVRKISNFSAFGIIDREQMDVRELLEKAVTTFADRDDIPVTLDIEVSEQTVNIDEELMVQALHNIMTNSLEAGSERITIRSRKMIYERPAVEHGQYVPAGSYVRISLKDDGKGIEQSRLVEVFDPYYSTKKRGSTKGMGLGLAVVYATVRNHGGYIIIESEQDTGTTVSIFIPHFVRILARQGDRLPKSTAGERFILLISDDEQDAQVAMFMLDHLNFQVIRAVDGEEAIKKYRAHIRAGIELSAALVNLPGDDARDGVAVCDKLHEVNPNLSVIALGGLAIDPVILDCRSYGFVNALLKPYTIDDLRNVLSVIASE